jgi:hypothetical protein
MKDEKGHGSDGRGGHSSGINKIPGVIQVHPNTLRVITNNPNGASVKPQTGTVPTGGYMVSLPGRTSFQNASDLSGPKGGKIVSDYARANADKLAATDMHIGSWHDQDTGKVHLDVSQNIGDRATAMRMGRQQNQKMIYDVARKKLIDTGGTGD